MATKAKETVEVETTETETPTDEPVTKANIVEVVKDVLKDLLPAKAEGETETEEKGETKKRPSLRDEEENTRSLVAQAVKEFLAKAPEETDESEKTKEREKVPGAVTVRKIERWMGWSNE